MAPLVVLLTVFGVSAMLFRVFRGSLRAGQVGMGGHQEGIGYLWFRAPLQAVFLAWVAYFGLVVDLPHRVR